MNYMTILLATLVIVTPAVYAQTAQHPMDRCYLTYDTQFPTLPIQIKIYGRSGVPEQLGYFHFYGNPGNVNICPKLAARMAELRANSVCDFNWAQEKEILKNVLEGKDKPLNYCLDQLDDYYKTRSSDKVPKGPAESVGGAAGAYR